MNLFNPIESDEEEDDEDDLFLSIPIRNKAKSELKQHMGTKNNVFDDIKNEYLDLQVKSPTLFKHKSDNKITKFYANMENQKPMEKTKSLYDMISQKNAQKPQKSPTILKAKDSKPK